MISVGYGDITPVTIIEKVFVIVVIIVGQGVFAYTVSSIGSIYQEISYRNSIFKNHKYEISMYMRARAIPQ
jgi:hypothetical protein